MKIISCENNNNNKNNIIESKKNTGNLIFIRLACAENGPCEQIFQQDCRRKYDI